MRPVALMLLFLDVLLGFAGFLRLPCFGSRTRKGQLASLFLVCLKRPLSEIKEFIECPVYGYTFTLFHHPGGNILEQSLSRVFGDG